MRYEFTHGCHPLPDGGLPHSEIIGSTLGCSSPMLFAAAHVLLRHSTPRHPPHACSSFFFVPLSLRTSAPAPAISHQSEGLPSPPMPVADALTRPRRCREPSWSSCPSSHSAGDGGTLARRIPVCLILSLLVVLLVGRRDGDPIEDSSWRLF